MDDIQPLKILKQYRAEQNPPLSQGELADQLGVRRETVARWESGQRKIDDEKLPEVARLTGISREALRPDLARLFNEAAE